MSTGCQTSSWRTISKTHFLEWSGDLKSLSFSISLNKLYIIHHKLINQCFITVPSRLLTLALLASCLLQGIAVETPPAALAVFPLCVSHAFQTSAGGPVTYSHRVEVHVAIAVASHARSSRPILSQGVTIVTVFTHLTAHPYTRERGGYRSRQELDG